MIPRRIIRSALRFIRMGLTLIAALAVVGVIYEQVGARGGMPSDSRRSVDRLMWAVEH